MCVWIIYEPVTSVLAAHSSILAWRVPGTEEPSGLLSMGLHGVRHDWSDLAAAAAAALYVGEGNGTPLQYSCLENPMDGGAWWAAVYGVARSQTRLKWLSSSSSSSIMSRKINVPILIKNISLLKNADHHLSLQRIIIFLLLEGLALIFDYGFLTRVVVAEVWGWLWQFLKLRLVLHTCTQSSPTLWDAMDCSLPGSSVHGIFQARILEWVTISYSRGSS